MASGSWLEQWAAAVSVRAPIDGTWAHHSTQPQCSHSCCFCAAFWPDIHTDRFACRYSVVQEVIISLWTFYHCNKDQCCSLCSIYITCHKYWPEHVHWHWWTAVSRAINTRRAAERTLPAMTGPVTVSWLLQKCALEDSPTVLWAAGHRCAHPVCCIVAGFWFIIPYMCTCVATLQVRCGDRPSKGGCIIEVCTKLKYHKLVVSAKLIQ